MACLGNPNRCLRFALILLGGLCLPQPLQAAINWKAPPAGLFEDRWYVVLVNGQRCGYGRMATKRVDQKIESLSFIEIGIQRGPVPIKLVLRSVQQETIDGKPLSFEVEQFMSLATVKKSGTVRDGRVYITTTEQGRSTKADYAWDARSKMAWATTLAIRSEPLSVGKTFDLWTYDAMVRPSGPVQTKIRVVGREKIDLLGKSVEAFKVESTTVLGVPITTTSYADDTGADLKTSMDLGFVKAEMISCTQEYAQRKGTLPELFLQTVIEVGRPLDTKNLRRIRYRLHMADKVTDTLFPTTGMQKVIRREEKSVELDVRRIDWNALFASNPASQPATTIIPDDIKPYLQASTFLDAKDPQIVELARKAVGTEKNPARMADLLRRSVSEYIEKKDLSVGLASASEVVRSRQGDCTEHGVLLAAMARAVGIPARCVGGIVYVSSMVGKNDIFGFHMWAQVWLNGQWVDIDGALRQTDCDPTHIAMEIMTMNEDGMADIAAGIIPFIGKTRIEIIETEK